MLRRITSMTNLCALRYVCFVYTMRQNYPIGTSPLDSSHAAHMRQGPFQIQPLMTPSLSFCLTLSIHCLPLPRMPPLARLLTALNSKRLRSSFSRKFKAVAGQASGATEPISSANMNGLLFVEKPSEVLARPSPRVWGAM